MLLEKNDPQKKSISSNKNKLKLPEIGKFNSKLTKIAKGKKVVNTLTGKEPKFSSPNSSNNETENEKTSNVDKDLELTAPIPNNISVKEMVEKSSVDQRAMTVIKDILDLFTSEDDKNMRKSRKLNTRKEKYELVDKDEYEEMIRKNGELSKKKEKLKLVQ